VKTMMSLVMVAAVAMTAQWAAAGDKDSGAAMACPAGVCAAPPAAAAAAPVAKEAVVNTEALATMMRLKVPMTILDARSGKYDDGRRLPGAKALSPMAKDAEVTAALPDKTALIVTYCVDPKCPASHQLGEKLRALGYTNVLEDHEGIEGWVAAGKPVEQAPK
jgi:rhodanese-related sulfurtransferase